MLCSYICSDNDSIISSNSKNDSSDGPHDKTSKYKFFIYSRATSSYANHTVCCVDSLRRTGYFIYVSIYWRSFSRGTHHLKLCLRFSTLTIQVDCVSGLVTERLLCFNIPIYMASLSYVLLCKTGDSDMLFGVVLQQR